MIIAITGCIGSGKSYILNKINSIYKIDVFSSDEFVLKAYDDENIKSKLNDVFSCVVNNKVDKTIIKSKLNNSNIDKLNEIIHPFVKKMILDVKRNYKDSIAFIEVPLLFETNMDILFDASIAIDVDDDLRHQRLKNRNPNNYLNMLKLEKRQLSNEQKIKRATYVLKSSENDDLNLRQLNDIIYVINKSRGN